jgi:prefoldin subunit 5
MLTAFATELNSTQSELEALLAKVEALKGQIKTLKAAENKVLKVVENLRNLVAQLPEVAINELKKEILSLFPSESEPIKEPAPVISIT